MVNFGINTPYDRPLCGARIHTQGYGFGGGPTRLHHADGLEFGTQ